jgi:hypothetical protein
MADRVRNAMRIGRDTTPLQTATLHVERRQPCDLQRKWRSNLDARESRAKRYSAGVRQRPQHTGMGVSRDVPGRETPGEETKEEDEQWLRRTATATAAIPRQ